MFAMQQDFFITIQLLFDWQCVSSRGLLVHNTSF